MKKECLNKVVKSPVPVVKEGLTVFLAGPMKGAPKWQRTVPKLAEEMGITGVTFLNPYPCQRWVSWKTQVDWEAVGLGLCDIAFFWVPNQETKVPGRTTPRQPVWSFWRISRLGSGSSSASIPTSVPPTICATRHGTMVSGTSTRPLKAVSRS